MASVTVVGGALAAATFAADEAQDVGRGITVAVTVLNRAPVSSAQPVGRMIGTQFGGFATDVSRQIADQLPASKGDALLTGIRQAKLEEAGLSKGVASRVASNVDDLDTATDVVNRLGDLDEVSAGARGTMLSEVATHDDALRLASDLDAGSLAKAVEVDGLDKASRIVTQVDGGAALLRDLGRAQTGRLLRAEAPASLIDEFNQQQLRTVLDEDAVRLVERLGFEKARTAFRVNRFDEIAEMHRATGGDAVGLFTKLSNRGKYETFLTLTVRKGDDVPADLEKGVRLRLATAFANDELSARAIAGLTDSIRTLDGHSQVNGLAKVLADDVYQTSNWYNVRGALYEIHSTDQYLVGLLREGDELQMGYKPAEAENINYNALEESQVESIASRLGLTQTEVAGYLGRGQDGTARPEFDGLRFAQVGDEVIYYEAKSGGINVGDLEKKSAFFLGYARLTGVDDPGIEVVSRQPASASNVNNNAVQFLEDTEGATFTQVEWNYRP